MLASSHFRGPEDVLDGFSATVIKDNLFFVVIASYLTQQFSDLFPQLRWNTRNDVETAVEEIL